MSSQFLLKDINALFASHSHAHLNDVQVLVLQSSLEGQSYPQMANRSTYTVEYLREVGADLWRLLSQVLNEPVSKKNVQSVLQGYQQSLASIVSIFGARRSMSQFFMVACKSLKPWISGFLKIAVG